MRILVIGATGAIGSAVVKRFESEHEVVKASRRSGDHQVDITDARSVASLFERIGHIDAIVSATGETHFGPLGTMSAEQFGIGLQSKLLGQVRLALVGQHFVSDGGSITLTSGITAHEPIRGGSNAAAASAGIEGFVTAAAIDMPRGIRINAVCPTVLTESSDTYGPFFPGFATADASRVALAYQRSVEGAQTGRVYRVW